MGNARIAKAFDLSPFSDWSLIFFIILFFSKFKKSVNPFELIDFYKLYSHF
jgi:hypothetical protein